MYTKTTKNVIGSGRRNGLWCSAYNCSKITFFTTDISISHRLLILICKKEKSGGFKKHGFLKFFKKTDLLLASNFKRLRFKASTIPLFFTWPNVHVKKVELLVFWIKTLKIWCQYSQNFVFGISNFLRLILDTGIKL